MAAKATFPVVMKDGSTPEVEGYLVAPGLAVHRCILLDGSQGNDWNVTHIPSGARVCGSFATRRDALLAAEQFALLADWSLEDGVSVFRLLQRDVLNIRNQILWESEKAHDKRQAKETTNLQEGLFS